ncbi:MAG: DUF1302 domain-containing protein [Pseudomonadota bacterium]|nr:DUF1302 domain-containing protein [Pseudomonadota bacterium]
MKQGQSGGGVFYKSMISCLIMVFAGVLWFSPPARAFEVYENDAVRIQLDSTVSYGLQWRVQHRDDDIIGIADGGNKHSCNYDDGNLNYDKGLIGNAIKMTSDLDIDAGWFGAFVRGSAFYDYENDHEDRERTHLNSDAKDAVGSDIDLLDCYLWISREVAGMPFQLRVGEQVVSWGESTFIQNSINTINSVDVSKLRVPGAELKEALTPEGIIWATINPTDNFTIEAFYEYDWEETKLDSPGTYFSSADYVGQGGYKLMLGFGQYPDGGEAPVDGWGVKAPMFAALGVPGVTEGGTFYPGRRGGTEHAKNSGQGGVALRYYAEALNNTEFSFYAMNYHARIPTLQAHTGTMANIGAALAAGKTAMTNALAAGYPAAVASQLFSGAAVESYLEGAGSYYRTNYEEDLQLYGIGFNTEIANIGFQGEISWRPDSPLQVDDLEILETWLSPLFAPLGKMNQSQLGVALPDSLIKGFIEKDIVQMQTTLSYVLPPFRWLGSRGGVILGEVGWEHICGMPGKDRLRLEGPATSSPGGDHATATFGEPVEASRHFADGDSWGYRILAKLDYFNVIGPIGFSPRIAWSHDVSGISPVGGPFLEDRKAVTFGLGANYLSSWTADLSYTNYFGADAYNLINDRDFISLNVKYSF